MKDAARARRRWIGDARRLPHTSPGEERHKDPYHPTGTGSVRE